MPGLDERHPGRRRGRVRRQRVIASTKLAGTEPQRPSTQLIGEQTDGDHRQDVIEPAERVREAVHEAMCVTAGAGMREGCARCERHCGQREAERSSVAWNDLSAARTPALIG